MNLSAILTRDAEIRGQKERWVRAVKAGGYGRDLARGQRRLDALQRLAAARRVPARAREAVRRAEYREQQGPRIQERSPR